jgi:A/G-specific adenine glycosylase
MNLSQLPEALLPWYEQNKRDLPWRADHDPYHIWLSEIMLQQTRVEAVKDYYTHFLAALPTISYLANCDDEALHKLWEGLGYYSRVRNLKKCAQVIMAQYDGQFPKTPYWRYLFHRRNNQYLCQWNIRLLHLNL